MARRIRARGAALAAVGAMAAVGPLVATARPAAAAQSQVDNLASITFIDTNGATATCSIEDLAVHNTDDPNLPYTAVSSGRRGGSGDCVDTVDLTITIAYNNRDGARRTATFDSFATGNARVDGTFSGITTSVQAHYFHCDASRSATCDLTVTANPK